MAIGSGISFKDRLQSFPQNRRDLLQKLEGNKEKLTFNINRIRVNQTAVSMLPVWLITWSSMMSLIEHFDWNDLQDDCSRSYRQFFVVRDPDIEDEFVCRLTRAESRFAPLGEEGDERHSIPG